MLGTVVLERFRIEQLLGSGGFGTVYRAWDERLERDVAVKVIEAGGAESGRRVLREAQAAARLNHPGIVILYELGEEDGRAYLVSELIEGSTLRQLSSEGELCDREVAEIGADLCEALDHAHARGVVHRDIKPQNILVPDGEGPAKLMDFGIARVLDGAALTAPGDVVGTLAYMAPEQAEGIEAGPETDVYSLALTLYECWGGENPHLRQTAAATARAIGEPLTSLGRLRPDLPAPVVDAIDASLDPIPDRRPSLEEVGAAIEDSLEGLDEQRRLPRPQATPRLGRFGGADAADLASAAIAAGLLAAAMISVGSGGAAWALLLAPLTAAVWILRPRAGYLCGVFGLSLWLVIAAQRPGTALVLATITLPPALLLSGEARALMLPAAAPTLAALGLGPAFPAVAALAGRWRDRAVLAATGFVWLALAEVVLRRDLLFGPAVDPSRGWQDSAASAASEVLWPLFTDPAFLGLIVVWSAAALIAGIVLAPARAWLARHPVTGSRAAVAARIGTPAAAGSGGGQRATLP